MDVNLVPLLPAVQVLVTALVVTVRDLFIKANESRGVLAFYSLVGLGLAAAEVVLLLGGKQESAFNDSFMLDRFALFFAVIFIFAAALTILTSIDYVRQAGIHEGEFYALILFATVGHDCHGGGQRFDGFLPRPGNHVDRGLRAHRHVAFQRPI